MTNTRPVLNLQSAIADVKGPNGQSIGKAYLVSPWNSFFQQFTQQAPAIADVTSLGSPFTANQNGTVILTGATAVSLTRGIITINLTGERIIPISIGDTVSWLGPATVQFLGS